MRERENYCEEVMLEVVTCIEVRCIFQSAAAHSFAADTERFVSGEWLGEEKKREK